MPLPSSATTEIGGRYRIEGPLGRGGMAEVRAGTDLRLQRPVAVKFLLPEMAAREDIRRRFEAEACAAASLSDPHAVAVYDTGEHEGLPYIVMERLPGETLADRIATGPQDPAWVRQVAGEVLAALGAAHAAGLVHRDVKPGNILITADDHAKIADFGIAKSLEASDGSLDLTGTGQLLGTPAYLPPERLDGGPATAQSDLYSLGVVLYEALTGRCPFPGETPVATAMAIVAGDYPPARRGPSGARPRPRHRRAAGHGHRPGAALRVGGGDGRRAGHARPHRRHGRRPDPGPRRRPGDRHPRPPRDAGDHRGPACPAGRRRPAPLPCAARRRADRPGAGRPPRRRPQPGGRRRSQQAGLGPDRVDPAVDHRRPVADPVAGHDRRPRPLPDHGAGGQGGNTGGGGEDKEKDDDKGKGKGKD